MAQVNYLSNEIKSYDIPAELLANKRQLTTSEIEVLKSNCNHNEDSSWKNIYVDKEDDFFDPSLIIENFFSGYIILGKIKRAVISYNDIHLECGIRKSKLNNVVIGDDCAIHNVAYLDNYHIGNRVILFNVDEICCTNHSKFGNGILKKGESEDKRVWLGVGNENDGRSVLAFESMIPSDAYIWSHYRDDNELLTRFVELTEYGNSGELNTYGIIEDDVVIKNTSIVKDSKIGTCAYIKGAYKLKNFTMLSSKEEPSQIGEGVILVNGILGYGSKVFYHGIAVRFVIGRNCQLKYGARLLNTVLGDNSTISCCEVLNNLIFPFHEQHHNSSFLIASTVMGQSNIASGSTIGSNHNSRSPDGEIFAKRGFWPGLCSDFKHNSRFASFVLVAKGSYQNELDIPYPFSLVSTGQNGDNSIHIIPAWSFLYNMYSITRNKDKFIKRDKRVVKVQNIEFDPLAPDTIQEILEAINRIIKLTKDYLISNGYEPVVNASSLEEELQASKDYLHKNPDAAFTLFDSQCQKKYGAVIFKPVQSYKMYRKIMKYFIAQVLINYCNKNEIEMLSQDVISKIRTYPLFMDWENVGGQIIPSKKVSELFELIKDRKINTWDSVHEFYNECEKSYEMYKVRYALYVLEWLYSRPIEEFTQKLYENFLEDVKHISEEIYNDSFTSREKDYTDYYRNMTYQNKTEMLNVIGSLEENSALNKLKKETEIFNERIVKLFKSRGGGASFLNED